MQVTLFSKTNCAYCDATEKRFARKGIEYRKVMIDDDLQQELIAAGHRAMPVVRAEKAGQKVMEFAGFSEERINQLSTLIKAS